MKTLATLLLLTPLFSCGQKYFEGEIMYSNEMIKKDSSFDLNRIPCAETKSTVIAYKNGDFFSRPNNCFIEYQYFDHTMSQVFYKLRGVDTLLFEDYNKNPPESDSIISVTNYNKTDTVLNKICNRIVVQRTNTKMIFVYSPDLKLNPAWYKNARSGYYDVIYGQMKSVFLKYIIEGEGYISTSIATKIDYKPIANRFFPEVAKLPKAPL
jgi:hypothetical protein